MPPRPGCWRPRAIVEAVAEAVAETAIPNLVVDPVSVSKHGHRLLDEDAVGALRERILPLATLVTPNLPEAAVLAGFEVTDRDLMEDAAETIQAMGPEAVLVKGGHLPGATGADDLFFDGDRMAWIAGERIETPNTHGTGCTLSSAIAAYLARGDELLEAVREGEGVRHRGDPRRAAARAAGSGPSISCGGSGHRATVAGSPAERDRVPEMPRRRAGPCRP